MTLDELDAVHIVGGPDGALYDIGANPPRCIAAPGAVDPAYFNLLRSISLTHIALKSQIAIAESLVESFEANGLDVYVPLVMQAATSGMVARRIAVEGVEVVQAEQQRNRDNGR